MEYRPIEGRDRGCREQTYRYNRIPAPGTWVLSVVYPDMVVWYRYPVTGDAVAKDADYASRSDGTTTHPPYEERAGTAILKRKWPDGIPEWKATPWFTLTVDRTALLTIADQPLDDAGNELWWDVVTETLLRYTHGESVDSVLSDLDAEHLNPR